MTSAAFRMYAGEFLATFIFLFAVCACTLNSPLVNLPTITPLCAGFAAFAVVFCFGGHFNTAVTLGAVVGGKMDIKTGLIYMLLQLVASFAAIGAIDLMFPGTTNAQSLMVMPAPTSSLFSAVLMEIFLSFILVFVIYCSAMGVVIKPRTGVPAETPAPIEDLEAGTAASVKSAPKSVAGSAVVSVKDSVKVTTAEGDASGPTATVDGKVVDVTNAQVAEAASEEQPLETVKEFNARVKAAETRKNHAPLVIGLTIAFLGTTGSTVSGGAFNPLRATAPAFFTLNFNYIWIYWVGDCIGGALAGLTHYYLFEDK